MRQLLWIVRLSFWVWPAKAASFGFCLLTSPPLPRSCVQATGIACCPLALGYVPIDSAEWFQGSFAECSSAEPDLGSPLPHEGGPHVLGMQSPKPWDMGHEMTAGGLLCPFLPPVLLPLAILLKGGTVLPAS